MTPPRREWHWHSYARGKNRVKYFKVRAGLAAPTSLYSTATTAEQPTARSLFGSNASSNAAAANATAPLPESAAYAHDSRREDTKASIRRGERLHASLVKTGVLPALPGHAAAAARRGVHTTRTTPSKERWRARSLITGHHRTLRPGAAASAENVGAASSPLRRATASSLGAFSSPLRRASSTLATTTTATSTLATGGVGNSWKNAKAAATRAALAFEAHQRKVDAAVVIQFRWRKARLYELHPVDPYLETAWFQHVSL